MYGKGPDLGVANVYIDDLLVDQLDQYLFSYGAYQPGLEKEYAVTGADPYRIRVVPSGTKNASATGYGLLVDAFYTQVSVSDEIPQSSSFLYALGAYPNGAYSPSGANLGTAQQVLAAADFKLPAKDHSFIFARYFNSGTAGLFGQGWTASIEWQMQLGASTVSVLYPGGGWQAFTQNNQTTSDGVYTWYGFTDPVGIFDQLWVRGGYGSATSPYKLTFKDGTTVLFQNGKVTNVTSALWNVIYFYDNAGCPRCPTLLQYDTLGDNTTRFFHIEYVASPYRIFYVWDDTGRTVRYEYDVDNRLTKASVKMPDYSSQWPTAPKWQYGYTSGVLTTVTDPSGRVVLTNEWDVAHRGVVAQTDALGNRTKIFYRASLGTTRVADPRGNAATYTFDSRKRVLSAADPIGTTSFTYDAAGNRTSVTDRRANRSDYTLDSRGNLTSATGPAVGGVRPVTSYAYDAKSNTTQVTDPLGFVSTAAYDTTFNQVTTSASQIAGSTYATTGYAYGTMVNGSRTTGPTTVTSPAGRITTTTYGVNNQVSSVTDGDGAKTTYGYDAIGRRTTTVTPEGNVAGGNSSQYTWTTAYDLQDNVTSEMNPLGQTRSYTYDAAGRRLTATDARGNVTTYAFDAQGHLATTQQKPDPVGQPSLVYTTTLTRDANGNVTRVTEGNGNYTDYTYDVLNRLVGTTTHPTPGTNLLTALQLDANGNVTRRTTGDGVFVDYTYDALDRLTLVSGPGLTINYFYDLAGHRTSMIDAIGTSTYTYDGLGRMTQAAQPNGQLSYGYDLDSNRTSLTYPGNQTVAYAYTLGGRLSTVTDWAGRVSQYTYSAGMLTQLDQPNGFSVAYTWDRAQRLTNLVNVAGGLLVSSHVYTLDGEGHRTALDEFVSGITAPGGTDHFGYTYDGLNRLTAVTTTNPETFTLDGGSNITARTGPSASWTIDGSDRPTTGLTWSTADRLTNRGADTFGYDALDRLTSSAVWGASRTYAYNGDGLLQSRTPGPTNFLWDPASNPSRLLQIGTDRLVYGLGPLYIASGSSVVNLARDGQKSVRAEVSGSTVSSAFRYHVYGDIAQSYGVVTPTYLGYAGQLLDASGAYYMRARWYDPASMRFMTRDPLSVPMWSGFAYGSANPLTMTDPTGLLATTGSDEGGGACVDEACYRKVPYSEATYDAVLDASTNPVVVSDERTVQVMSAVIAAVQVGGTKPSGLELGTNGKVTAEIQRQINRMGDEYGCHQCGARESGTRSGEWIGDHLPSTALKADGAKQYLYPHCVTCSARQGAAVQQAKGLGLKFSTVEAQNKWMGEWLSRLTRATKRGGD